MNKLISSIFLYLGFLAAVSADPVITNSKGIPEYVMQELRQIMHASGEEKIAISSKKRSVKKQVEVMLDYYIECTKASSKSKQQGCGIERAKRAYHPDCHGGFDFYDANKSRERNITLMTIALTDSLIALGDQRICMNHVELPGFQAKFIAVDIRPSSVKDHVRFFEAVVANSKVTQFYYPNVKGKPKSLIYDDAFHIEFLRQQEPGNDK